MRSTTFHAHIEKIRELIASASDRASLIEAPYAVADLEAYAVGTQALASHAQEVRQRAHEVRQRLLAEYEPDTDRDRFDEYMGSITAHMDSIRGEFDDYAAKMTALLDRLEEDLEEAIEPLRPLASSVSSAAAASIAASIIDAKLAGIADAERRHPDRYRELSELADIVAEPNTDRDRFDEHMESITAHMGSIRGEFDDYGYEMSELLDHLDEAVSQLEPWASSHAAAASTAASIVDAKLADIADAERRHPVRPRELSELAVLVEETLASLADSDVPPSRRIPNH